MTYKVYKAFRSFHNVLHSFFWCSWCCKEDLINTNKKSQQEQKKKKKLQSNKFIYKLCIQNLQVRYPAETFTVLFTAPVNTYNRSFGVGVALFWA